MKRNIHELILNISTEEWCTNIYKEIHSGENMKLVPSSQTSYLD